ncbi:FAD:protein FMN transferase [Jeotgalibaca caeni]|uniref:FAD:protein FMN transferase n=1 Tax=Jeotgalibaca caeni TaxID=3028623 RepID=UPI00237E9D57|nr:FAD:protein FMN transferase [Jeotgalibaca caeni]MDE1548572.1 FAD:protein FMN transferase [Jeotgalibaca caeni]
MMKKIARFIAFFFLAVFFLAACGNENEEEKLRDQAYEDTEFLMGTYVTLRIYNEGKEAVLAEGFELVRDLADKITGETQESEISKINAAAGSHPVEVSDDVYEVLKIAADYSKTLNGQFNYVLGSITNLWRIGFDDARKPGQAEIDEALQHVDFTKVVFHDEEQSVFLMEEGMELDLGAIAKGYMTDRIRDLFASQGVTSAIIDLGGNVFVMGGSPSRDGEVWNVGIQDPQGSRGESIGSTIQSDRSIVTSGIYERYLEVDGKIYHHLMNPETGYPFDNEIIGVSIISENSVDGDALSTLVFGLGLEEGLEYVNGREDVEAIFITQENEIYLSDGLEDNFELTNETYTLVAE